MILLLTAGHYFRHWQHMPTNWAQASICAYVHAHAHVHIHVHSATGSTCPPTGRRRAFVHTYMHMHMYIYMYIPPLAAHAHQLGAGMCTWHVHMACAYGMCTWHVYMACAHGMCIWACAHMCWACLPTGRRPSRLETLCGDRSRTYIHTYMHIHTYTCIHTYRPSRLETLCGDRSRTQAGVRGPSRTCAAR